MNRACDQCNLRRTKCSRELPICHACRKTSLTCSWNRKHNNSSNPNYQNVDTFSLSQSPLQPRFSKRDIKAKRKDDSCTFKHYSFLNRSLVVEQTIKGFASHESKPFSLQSKKEKEIGCTRFPSLMVPVKSNAWAIALQHWLANSDSRQDFYIMAKYSGVSLEEASRQDHKFLSFLLLNRNGPQIVSKRMVLQVDIKISSSNNLLNKAVDAYFHYFNPFYTLFTRKSFHSLPRSMLLKLVVWRSGIQFLPGSPLKSSLEEWLDDNITKSLSLYKITPTLDKIQCYFIIGAGIGLSSSCRLHNKWPYFNIALSLTHQLGLNKKLPSFKNIIYNDDYLLERKLAYQATVSWDTLRIFSIGIPFFALGSYSCTYNNNSEYFYNNYRDQLLKSPIHHSTCNIEKNILTDSTILLFHATMDICALVSSDTISECSNILLKFRYTKYKIIHNKIIPDNFLRVIFKTIQKFCLIVCKAQEKLNRFRECLIKKMPLGCSCKPIWNETYKNSLLVFDQAICYILIIHCSSILHLCDLGSNLKHLCKFKDTVSFRSLNETNIALGLYSSINLINLMKRVGTRPFLFIRLNPLTCATHFILKNYHLIQSNSFTNSYIALPSQADLTQALCISYQIIENLKKSNFFSFHTTYILSLFDTLLAKYKVVIPK